MKPITIMPYFDEDTFNDLPSYTLNKLSDDSYRLEWEPYYTGDSELERWAIITYNKETTTLFIEFEYNDFKYLINSGDFSQFFSLYFTHIEKFVEPLGKLLFPSIEESIDAWEKTVFEYQINDNITEEEYVNVINFFREKCYIQSPPAIVIENILLESPLLNSLFKNPVDLFPLLYSYPFCTKFFLKYIVPILYEVIVIKNIFK